MEQYTDVIKRTLTEWDNIGLYGVADVSNPPKLFDFGDDERLELANKLYNLELQGLECIDNEKLVSLRNCKIKMESLKEKKENLHEMLKELDEKYTTVTDKSSSLHHACDQMMSQQTQMAAGTEQLKTNLHYYTQWEWIMKKLQTSRLLITGTVFPQIISTIHECMVFLREHPEHRESLIYLEKYEQCLSRALTAIKAGVMADIAACEQEVLTRQASNKPIETVTSGATFTDDDTFALLYGVFGVKAGGVKNALTLVHQYFSDNLEYQEMVTECEQEYFRIREQLLKSAVERTIQSLITKHKDSSCTLTRDGCSVLLRLCDDEFRLYKQFFIVEGIQSTGFNSVSPGSIARSPTFMSNNSFWTKTPKSFTEFVEGMCRILYDQLRPLIIHNPHMETLAQLCTLLKIEMIEERCGSLVSMMHDEADNFINPREGFVHVMNDLVGDIVERIVYRTSLFGQHDIVGYNPAPGDLAYPERLLMMKNIEAETVSTPKSSDGLKKQSSTSAIDLHCLWYPTVRRTIVCLSKLYKCLDQGVFISISRELLDQCCQSLEYAAEKMRNLPIDPAKATVKGFGRQLDAELFIVKHLLIIREQTSPYRITAKSLKSNIQGNQQIMDSAISHFDYSLDLSHYGNQAMQLFTPENRAKWFELSPNNAFLSFLLSSPVQVQELQTDSRRIIEQQVKKHCHKLIKFVVDMITSGLGDLTMEINNFESQENKDLWKKNLKLQPKNLNDVVSEVLKNLKQNWPMIRAAFTLYIGVRETEEILLQPIRNSVREVFKNVNLFVQTYFTEEQRQVASVPDSAQIWVLLNA